MQVFVIHGGNAFSSYEDYLSYLRGKEINIERLSFLDWKSRLPDTLSGHQVLLPQMPNKQNAKYAEWKIWFERLIPFMEDDLTLIGHSLGGSFLAKYLAEEGLLKKIKATFLVAAPYDHDGDLDMREFTPPQHLEKFAKQGGKIFLYHSKDDPVVNFSELAKYQRALPSAVVRVFEDRQHFNQEAFPELVADLRSLA